MPKLDNNTSTNLWEKTFSVTNPSGSILLLETQNKFIDKNIAITMTVPNASTTGNAGNPYLNLADTNSLITVGTATGGYYPLSAESLSGSVNYDYAGWVTTGTYPVSDVNV
jgi:hypothetical protein